MAGLWCSLLTLILCGPAAEENNAMGYLLVPQEKTQHVESYRPRQGDMVFFDDHNPYWSVLFAWAGTGPPMHMGIVVKRYNGSLAILESGPDRSSWVTLQPVGLRLRQFDENYHGTISIRRCKNELTRPQSRALTYFAEAQEGKMFAFLRFLLQGTPLRSRGLIQELLLAQTPLDRWSWMCSELVVAAGTVAELFPPRVKATATYPQDIVNNLRHDLSKIWTDAEIWRPSRR